MWFDGERQPNTLYVASVSRGKDSTAMLRAIQLMGWPLDMIASVDIWATDDIPAELPPMVAFKDEWDAKCLEQFGVPVTRLCATRKVSDSQNVKVERERERATSGTSTERTPTETLVSRIRGKTEFTDSPSAQELGATDISKSPLYQKLTYEKLFYHVPKRRSNVVHVERERESRKADRIPANQGELVYVAQNRTCRKTQSRDSLLSTKRNGVRIKRDALRQICQWARMGDSAQFMVPIAAQGRSPRQSLFNAAPRTRGENKYRSLHRNRSRRAETH